MEELRVPTERVAVEVLRSDGTRIDGHIFMPMGSPHEGPMRPHEWANQPAPFFPFLPEGASRPQLMNKASVVVLSLREPHEEMAAPPVERRVVLECSGVTLEGTLHVEMPENRQRVVDFLNEPEPFVAVFAEGREHVVHKRYVLRVHELPLP